MTGAGQHLTGNHKEQEVTGDETGAGRGRADVEGCRPAKGITFAMERYYLLTGRPLMGDPFFPPEGAILGAWTSAFAYLFNCMVHGDVLTKVKEKVTRSPLPHDAKIVKRNLATKALSAF